MTLNTIPTQPSPFDRLRTGLEGEGFYRALSFIGRGVGVRVGSRGDVH
jgi:hypothetical protein